MAELTRAEVDEIALLARLELDDAEAERLRGDLSAILAHMDRLRDLDTTGVEPMTHAVPVDLPLRPDEIDPSLPVADALAGAPERADDCFQVPAIIANPGGG